MRSMKLPRLRGDEPAHYRPLKTKTEPQQHDLENGEGGVAIGYRDQLMSEMVHNLSGRLL